MPIKIRKPLNLLPDLWDKIEEQRLKENRSTYHNMIDTMIRAYLNKSKKTIEEAQSNINVHIPTIKESEIQESRSSFGGIKYDPNKIKL
jgi:hypothetical protein